MNRFNSIFSQVRQFLLSRRFQYAVIVEYQEKCHVRTK